MFMVQNSEFSDLCPKHKVVHVYLLKYVADVTDVQTCFSTQQAGLT